MSLLSQSFSAVEYFSELLFFGRRQSGGKDTIIEGLAKENERLKEQLQRRTVDLIDQLNSRRTWQKRALGAERALKRNPFAVLLIDGDGYIFRDEFIKDREKGAIKAGNELYDFFRNSVQNCNPDDGFPLDFEVVVRIYVNKSGLASAMAEAGIIPHPEQLDNFFVRLTQSHPLIDVVDCGSGKERVDEKIREQYRHYAESPHCRHISIACCHDSGYVAFLEKFQKDVDIEQKTSLFATGGQAHSSFSTLVFKRIICQSIFRNETHLAKSRKRLLTYAQAVGSGSSPASPESPKDCASVASLGGGVSISPPLNTASTGITSPSGPLIPINRAWQRVDIPLPTPSEVSFTRLRKRTKSKKLCTEFYLNGKCPQGKACLLDHNELKKGVKEALQFSLRAKACRRGPSCRQADCFYGHHCPVSGCAAKRSCEFKGMHGIEQVVAEYVPAAV